MSISSFNSSKPTMFAIKIDQQILNTQSHVINSTNNNVLVPDFVPYDFKFKKYNTTTFQTQLVKKMMDNINTIASSYGTTYGQETSNASSYKGAFNIRHTTKDKIGYITNNIPNIMADGTTLNVQYRRMRR